MTRNVRSTSPRVPTSVSFRLYQVSWDLLSNGWRNTRTYMIEKKRDTFGTFHIIGSGTVDHYDDDDNDNNARQKKKK